MSISIVLADDHVVVRQGLRTILAAEPDLKVVAETSDGLETVQTVERLRPDVLVLDLVMPNLHGLEVLRQVSERSPKTKVVVLSMHADEAYVLQALKNGALGYVIKSSGADELTTAIREVAKGEHYLGRPLSETAIDIYIAKVESEELDPYDTLSIREREVLHLVAGGNTNSRIASRLSISRRTVEVYRANIMRKLRLNSQAELIRYAIRLESPDTEALRVE